MCVLTLTLSIPDEQQPASRQYLLIEIQTCRCSSDPCRPALSSSVPRLSASSVSRWGLADAVVNSAAPPADHQAAQPVSKQHVEPGSTPAGAAAIPAGPPAAAPQCQPWDARLPRGQSCGAAARQEQAALWHRLLRSCQRCLGCPQLSFPSLTGECCWGCAGAVRGRAGCAHRCCLWLPEQPHEHPARNNWTVFSGSTAM